mmetsp:Transcript_39510/g.92926  ORF Transcript_39510/g.92926 Transcript_39510/m.92926 type:complete len:179 (+) Transcript_39510:76-612(+)
MAGQRSPRERRLLLAIFPCLALTQILWPLAHSFCALRFHPKPTGPASQRGTILGQRLRVAVRSSSEGESESAEPLEAPKHYYGHMQGTPLGGAFWRRKFDGQWGEYATGDAGKFDKDDLVEAMYDDGEYYAGQVMKYVGNSEWIVLWLDDLSDDHYEDVPKASTIKTKDMRHLVYEPQ